MGSCPQVVISLHWEMVTDMQIISGNFCNRWWCLQLPGITAITRKYQQLLRWLINHLPSSPSYLYRPQTSWMSPHSCHPPSLWLSCSHNEVSFSSICKPILYLFYWAPISLSYSSLFFTKDRPSLVTYTVHSILSFQRSDGSNPKFHHYISWEMDKRSSFINLNSL